MKILIVDDTKAVHAFVRNLLSRAPSIHVSDVFNGQEAIQTLSHANVFDLILLDWEMPIMTGPETLAHFKKMELKTPVIMMTTKNNMEDIVRMLELGAAEYLMKPFTVDILFEKIEAVIGKVISHAS